MFLQSLTTTYIFQLTFCNPHLCWPHLQVVCGCHGHAIGACRAARVPCLTCHPQVIFAKAMQLHQDEVVGLRELVSAGQQCEFWLGKVPLCSIHHDAVMILMLLIASLQIRGITRKYMSGTSISAHQTELPGLGVSCDDRASCLSL